MTRTEQILSKLVELSKNSEKKNRALIKELKRIAGPETDALFHNAHSKITESINCLECANCCKTISPIITNKDIERISRTLKVRPSDLVNQYLKVDEDGDYVFRQQPCPFIQSDNHCSIYEYRPKACRDYPHTDRKKMHQLYNLCLQNSKVCPIVYLVLDDIRKSILKA